MTAQTFYGLPGYLATGVDHARLPGRAGAQDSLAQQACHHQIELCISRPGTSGWAFIVAIRREYLSRSVLYCGAGLRADRQRSAAPSDPSLTNRRLQ
jgi:hypothetical protein